MSSFVTFETQIKDIAALKAAAERIDAKLYGKTTEADLALTLVREKIKVDMFGRLGEPLSYRISRDSVALSAERTALIADVTREYGKVKAELALKALGGVLQGYRRENGRVIATWSLPTQVVR